jgi:hypothetical protein
MRRVLIGYAVASGLVALAFGVGLARGGDPSTCWHPSLRTDGPVEW